MVRTQIYLTENERDQLAMLADATGKKQSELIREAVDVFIYQCSHDHRNAVLKEASGVWQHRTDLPNFTELRKSLDRM